MRLSALDPEAGAALRAITYFDTLAQSRPGLSAIVRGAVTLTGAAAGIVDPGRHVHLRVGEDGVSHYDPEALDPQWLSASLGSDDGDNAVLWIERPGPARTVDAVVLERAATLAREVLERTRGRGQARPGDTEWAQVLIDAEVPESTRRHAARAMGLPISTLARALALPGGKAHIQVMTPAPDASSGAFRAGIGPAVPVLELPASWTAAQVALRLSAEGTPEDPGPRTVYAEQMGGLALLAHHVGPNTPLTPDEIALQRAATTTPGVLITLDAVASTTSLRAAAAHLRIHHSTLQERLLRAERALGWSVTDPHGRLRFQLALVLHRLHRPAP